MEISTLIAELSIEGEVYQDTVTRTLYATDASVYREMPLLVTIPKSKKDMEKIFSFAKKHQLPLIPRAAGTSLGGQVVGNGIIVDISKYFNKILEVNKEQKYAWVEPGVNLDELNQHLAGYGLFFGPETSTSNRCRIGGMVGNNSCGSHSIIYGTTRDHLLEMKCFLSDGSDIEVKPLSSLEFDAKCQLDTLEGSIYRKIKEILDNPENQDEIRKEFPRPEIRRRNTGYALDELLETKIFTPESKEEFNLCKLLCGSEGTLSFNYAIKINLVDAPPKTKGAVAVHLNTIEEATYATLIALKYNPGAVELLDDIVLSCTKSNIEQSKNRSYIQGDPGALLVVEWARETKEEIQSLAAAMEAEMRAGNLGYHFPVLFGSEINAVWNLRKAGLGLLANVPGDPKAVACIEDTAVWVQDQPQFVKEFKEILAKYQMECVFYAHIGDGELHLRPILDLKIEKDRELFFTITDEVATLVKKFRGSLSGEHGDGRVRGEFIKKMVGEKNYQLFLDVKNTFDPNGLLNPGKIVNTPKMNEFLRYENNQATQSFDTLFDFSETEGILRMAEKCNGSGDCRKSHHIGGTMCPSYMATRNEKDTTRARANILREFLTRSPKANRFDHKEIYEVMDLCLSCKGCKSECPSNVDVATLKAEFLQHYYDANGTPLRAWAIGNISKLNALGSIFPTLTNFVMHNGFTGGLLKSILGMSPLRELPGIHSTTLSSWYKKEYKKLPAIQKPKGKVYLFCDEFTEYNDTPLGITAIKLLHKLGYEVVIPTHTVSGRTYLSKGLVRDAKAIAQKNVALLHPKVSAEMPLIGIEPSAILSFKDEYPRLVEKNQIEKAQQLAKNCLLIDDFLAKEVEKGNISPAQFTAEAKKIKLHGHCHQKALGAVTPTRKILELPTNYQVELIPSGCCGMAGSFGYEKEHYEVSMQVGELVLFPAVRKADENTLVAAPGTSCRHQIKDGTRKTAQHPVEILWNALI